MRKRGRKKGNIKNPRRMKISKKKVCHVLDDGEIGAHGLSISDSIVDEDLKRRLHRQEKGKNPKKGISCKTAKRYIRSSFAGAAKNHFVHKTPEMQRRHDMAINHMRKNSIIVCHKCWDYYTRMKQKHCGG